MDVGCSDITAEGWGKKIPWLVLPPICRFLYLLMFHEKKKKKYMGLSVKTLNITKCNFCIDNSLISVIKLKTSAAIWQRSYIGFTWSLMTSITKTCRRHSNLSLFLTSNYYKCSRSNRRCFIAAFCQEEDETKGTFTTEPTKTVETATAGKIQKQKY